MSGKLGRRWKLSDEAKKNIGIGHKTHGLTNTKEYRAWVSIRDRCLNPNSKCYYNWGGRGIKIYEEWINDPVKFVNYVKLIDGWSADMDASISLDRINNDGDYEPGNLRWTDKYIQSVNIRKKKNTSGYTGIYIWKDNGGIERICAKIKVRGKRIHLGMFKNVLDALEYRNNYIIEHNITEHKIQ